MVLRVFRLLIATTCKIIFNYNDIGVSVLSVAPFANLHSWLLSIDHDLLAIEEWLILNKFSTPKRLHYFKEEDASELGMKLCDKRMLLAAIANLPDTDAWP